MAKLIMLIGLPGSGKSTYATKLLDTNVGTKYLSSDGIRKELYGNPAIQGDKNKVFRIMHNRLKEYLKAGQDVVYDATNVTRKNRFSVINEVKQLCADGIEAHIIWAPYEECLLRDAARSRVVGEAVIRKFLYRWQSPNYDEGFTFIDVIFNCGSDWNRIHYSNKILDSLNIEHDNPHHSLNILNHCSKAEEYISNKWSKSSILQEAGAYHDIGKPFTKSYKVNKDTSEVDRSVAHYYQHDNVGGYFTYGFYADTAECKQKAVMTSWLVCNHMQPYFQSSYYKNLTGMYKEWLDMLHEADVAAH